jgi:hypothetical protein
MPAELIDRIRERGMAPVTEVVAWILGERPKGSWWAHPRSGEAYAKLTALEHEPDLLGAKLIDGKETLVHRRLWAALARAQREDALWPKLSKEAAAALKEIEQQPRAIKGKPRLELERALRVISVHRHTEKGHHEAVLTAFAQWLPRAVASESNALSLEDALHQLRAAGLTLPAGKAKK